MASKSHEALTSDVVRLSRQNAALRREVARLQIFRAMAYRDPLTGLWNRRYFEERLAEELSRSQRAGGSRRFSVMVVDIDDFKRVNDRHGHAVGDSVLREVGEFLVAHLRTHDVPCRSGGDEFSVLLPDLSAADCGQLGERLRAARLTANATAQLPVGFSLGTASWPEVGDSIDGLLAHADREMYADKRRRRSRRLPSGAVPRASATRGVPRRVVAPRARVPGLGNLAEPSSARRSAPTMAARPRGERAPDLRRTP